ncbi:MAG TPA: ClpXP protease specificity-enhancing factor SspB [Polyangia bacterium]|nr:ClpXP protease specificity-enhancing factor SspB [Polyangia bacterium]
MRSPERPSKQDAFLALLREGWTSLHLDARRPGVVVPSHLRTEGHLVLQYGHDLPIPIPDLEIDEYGVRATLSFAKTPHRTVVPWSAVYVVACDDGRGVLYHEDVPEDVSIVAARSSGPGDDLGELEPARPGEVPAGVNGRSGRITERTLRSVPADPATMEDEPGAAARRRRRPQLRLVK